MLRSVAGALAVVASAACPMAAAAAAGPPPPEVQALLARVDAAWGQRDSPGQLDAVRATLEEAQRRAPGSYGVLWRLSRLYFWMSDEPTLSDDEKSKLGKSAWELGDSATVADPNGVEGWFHAAGGVGSYALGIGVLNALGQGIEGKFKERLSKAEAIDPGYSGGAIPVAWGRFYFKLPWPKYDARDSEASLRKALRMNPDNVRARVYLAELYLKESHPREARKLLEAAIANLPGRYDAPEERRYQRRAREILANYE